MSRRGDFHIELTWRVSELTKWFSGALEVYEGRSDAVILEASDAFRRWATDGHASYGNGALVGAWEEYEQRMPRWSDDDDVFFRDIPVKAEPQWLFTEYQLVAGLVMAGHALDLLQGVTKKEESMIVAMLYADAERARDSWCHLRGLDRCRNPHPTFVRAREALKGCEDRIAIKMAATAEAKRKAQLKLAADPKQAVRPEAFKLWQDWQAGLTIHKSGPAFGRFVCGKYPVLEDPTTVVRWAREWAAEKRENRD